MQLIPCRCLPTLSMTHRPNVACLQSATIVPPTPHVPNRLWPGDCVQAMVATAVMHSSEEAAQRIIPSAAPLTVDPVQEVRHTALAAVDVFVQILRDHNRTLDDSLTAAGGCRDVPPVTLQPRCGPRGSAGCGREVRLLVSGGTRGPGRVTSGSRGRMITHCRACRRWYYEPEQ